MAPANVDEWHIATLINWHMRPYDDLSDNKKKKDHELLGDDLYNELMLLHAADLNAHKPKEREIPYWDEWYTKNKERVKERSKARYQLKRDEILEKNREWRRNHKDYYEEWRRNHKDYYKEWRRKKKEKEHECNGESESIIRES
jgi:hypothetical protein